MNWCKNIFYSLQLTTIVLVIILPIFGEAQSTKYDSSFFLSSKKGLIGVIGKSISVSNPITGIPQNAAEKNAIEFEPFEGKFIRTISIKKLQFNKLLNDTSINNSNIFNQIGNKLHISTRQEVVKKNLFFKPGERVDPNLFADNEKFLRDLSFLQDARIIIVPVKENADEVDVLILVKDVFPIGGSVSEVNTNLFDMELNNDNIFGSGNRLKFQQLFDTKRNPKYSYGVEFLSRNIAGSFLNVAAGINFERPAFNSSKREENSYFLRGDLPLVSPYHPYTGGFDLSVNNTQNAYSSDSLYNQQLKYGYYNADLWIGYSLGAKERMLDNLGTRKRNILSARVLHRYFTVRPDTLQFLYDSRYNDVTGMLFSYTIFERDFYHTNFIYGFGRNEDLPEGFSLSFTGGWADRQDVSRLYIGFEYQRSYFNNKKAFLNYTLKSGGYFNRNQAEDISALASLELITPLKRLKKRNWFVRHFLSGSVTFQKFIRLNDPLRVSSIFGIPKIRNTRIDGTARLTINAETVFYNTFKLVGFNFAPFVFSNLSYLKLSALDPADGAVYSALGAGLRSRNENLVFGTMELKAYYFPKIVENMNSWNISISTNLRFRYQTDLIRKPDFVVVN
ncbi:MAG TPA: hypothetical protein VJA82_09470 [Sediminibacterium sp.]|uniref:hypothetical protein n=1 Tax=Sediminibacterium sp. TaxID=1917865 RepID=UPI0008C4D97C|nr:hypothetical protein [Sediminibacterium sp.]OHC85244.1 MAG: hypothetical protein A2472_05555 [Sphingobacteriia bacterium RIFOXYC2_FULL_35_18]OHC89147.1 MAG: hypothetical protein A2546_07595 [Sphingobacteriia bacterium RIFOXYD2_FULL_35_12]HLD53523.1 hypothetical protein [Sediminibacterium sp.]